MLKKILCRMMGYKCEWRVIQVEKYVRDANGVFVGVAPPQVKCERWTQQCASCGEIRTKEITIPL